MFPKSFLRSERLFCELLLSVTSTSKMKQQLQNDLLPCGILLSNSSSYIEASAIKSIIAGFEGILSLSLSSPGDGDGDDRLLPEIEVEVRFRLCICMWLAGGHYRQDKTQCVAALLTCAKLDPNYGYAYTYLGHYYLAIQKDTARAEKCYQRALACYPLDTEAGYGLSKLYLDNNEPTKAQSLWENVEKVTSSHSFWSLSLKAHYYMYINELSLAIPSFQSALEINPDDGVSWFGLGTIYKYRFYLLCNSYYIYYYVYM